MKIGATGGYRMTIDIDGLASHAGNRPEEGVSAIAIASLAIADLVKNGWHGLIVEETADGHEQRRRDPRRRRDQRRHRPRAASRRSPQPRSEVPRANREGNRSGVQASGARGAQHGRQVRLAYDFDGRLDYEAFRLARDEPCVVAAIAAIEAEGLRAGARASPTAAWTPIGSPPTAFPP